jgi:hypothetical protein
VGVGLGVGQSVSEPLRLQALQAVMVVVVVAVVVA